MKLAHGLAFRYFKFYSTALNKSDVFLDATKASFANLIQQILGYSVILKHFFYIQFIYYANIRNS